MRFQVIPVVDLKAGLAVHAIAGRRAHYQPIQSILHPNAEPVGLAGAVRDTLGLDALYLADLDAIAGRPPSLAIYQHIILYGIRLIVDAGLQDATAAAPLLELRGAACTIVAGLETVRGPHDLVEIVQVAGAERVVFSLDLFDGRPRIAVPEAWRCDDPAALAREAIDHGVRHLLVIDTARVGTGRGLGTASLISRIRKSHSQVQISVGGGISRIEEIIELKNDGAAGVLVGSALHDGRIGRRELARLEQGSSP
jgi:phosphoribosylformimino-5-aminoimidazole carboxamide ribotide isomerase